MREERPQEVAVEAAVPPQLELQEERARVCCRGLFRSRCDDQFRVGDLNGWLG